MFVDMPTMKHELGEFNVIRLESVQDINVECLFKFSGNHLQVMKAPIFKSILAGRSQRNKSDQLFYVLANKGIECGNGVSNASLVRPSSVDPISKELDRLVGQLLKIDRKSTRLNSSH